MANISFGKNISLRQFADAIKTVGREVTIIGQGEPGIGKSQVLKMLAQEMPEYETAYIDCTLLDLGDFALPMVVDEDGVKVTRFAPNARFKMHSKKPVIVMLDEIGKAMKAVKNVMLTLMLERRIGDAFLPEGSIVFGTTNLLTDGVGDMLEAHARNRICFVTVRKPEAGFKDDGSIAAGSWAAWAVPNNIEPLVIACAREFPDFFESYIDNPKTENPYIFNPLRAGQSAFVTPRSLAKASEIVKNRETLGDDLVISLLSGVVGEPAARRMQTLFSVVDKLPTWASIVTDPDNAKLPTDVVAMCMLVFSAISKMDKKNLAQWIKYSKRMPKELQAMFAKSAMGVPDKQAICVMDAAFRDWALSNAWLF